MMSPRNLIEHFVENAPAALDLTDEVHLAQVLEWADALLLEYATLQEIDNLEAQLVAQKDQYPLMVHLAVKLAKSKRLVASLAHPVHVSVVFAVYQEHERIRTREENAVGENFLIRKIGQLSWLFDDFPGFSWDMFIVDDGCPDQSGRIAQQILAEKYDGDNVHVLFLEEAIAQQLPVTRPLRSTSESRKGGSIAYGMWYAAQANRGNHVILFTDADLSTHLGQTGLLLDGIINLDNNAAIGSRREPASVVVKTGVRNVRGKLFIYLWKRMVHILGYITDTQCGFKAFRAEVVREIIDGLIEKKFAFDIELLLKTDLIRHHSIEKVPIAWIDSEAASTTTAIQPYLTMLQGIAAMYHRYLSPNQESTAFANFVDSLTEESWAELVEHVPAAIAKREPAEFDEFRDVKVADLARILE
ncbi:MAG: hypothetical protein R3293_25735 [Candidatus Promineifilaceae bacterium]|nr:hypothetical protein [Candidatus Promineifilaceae bacterium]